MLYFHVQIYEKFIGFGKAESMGDDDGVPPAMAQIIDKIFEQESKYSNSLFTPLKIRNSYKILRNISLEDTDIQSVSLGNIGQKRLFER